MIFKGFLFLFIPIMLFAQQKENVVAEAGKYKIYESEFKERFDFSAHPYLNNKGDKYSYKHEFLEQLIAEKLLSLEARQKGYDTLDTFKSIMTPMENMYARDELYTREIKNRVRYSKEDIKEGIKRISRLLKLKFIYSKDPEELQNIFLSLKKGTSFDSLLSLRQESKDQAEPRTITFGTMEKEVEDSVYKLKPNEFTTPLASKDGFYIMKLSASEVNTENKDPKMTQEDVKRIVEKRAEYKEYLRYYRNFFTKQRAAADKEVFERLIRIFVSRFREKYPLRVSSENKFYLIGAEVNSAFDLLGPEIQKKDFIKPGGKPLKVKYFLNQLSQEGFYLSDLSEQNIRASLSSYIRKFIEDELLTQEATNNGLRNAQEVKKYTGMWRDAYLSKMLMLDIFDSVKVTEKEAFEIYKRADGRQIPIEKVKIAEVLTDSLGVIEAVLKELSKGRDIRDLARQYTKRDSIKDRGGESGYFPVTCNGEIGEAAAKMNIGDVYGPVKLKEGYSVFQLLDRKEDTTDHAQTFSEVKDQIMMKATVGRFENYINNYIAGLAVKYGVNINDEVLKAIDNTYINLVVVRYMGFGGQIYAVPYTEQFKGWYKLWMDSKDVNL